MAKEHPLPLGGAAWAERWNARLTWLMRRREQESRFFIWVHREFYKIGSSQLCDGGGHPENMDTHAKSSSNIKESCTGDCAWSPWPSNKALFPAVPRLAHAGTLGSTGGLGPGLAAFAQSLGRPGYGTPRPKNWSLAK